MSTQVIYADGSVSEWHGDGGSSHAGEFAIARLRLKTAIMALEAYIKFDGAFQLTRDGHRLAILNVIEPLSGKTFHSETKRGVRVSKAQCHEALEEARTLLWGIENNAVVWEE